MNNRILILGKISEHSHYIPEFVENLSNYDNTIQIDVIDLFSPEFFRYENKKIIKKNIIPKSIHKLAPNSLLFRFITLVFIVLFLCISKPWRTICMQQIHLPYKKYLWLLKLKSKCLVSVLWGSDFYRVQEKNKTVLKTILNQSDVVLVGSKETKNNVVATFPSLEGKVDFVNFGNDKICKAISGNNNESTLLLRKKWLPDYDNETVITVGYNNKSGQQHGLVFNELAVLPQELLEKIHLLIPLTYPKDEAYAKEIKEQLIKSKIRHTIIDRRITDEEIIELRKISDIFINMQITDLFSASMFEYIANCNVIVNGDWLPYDYLDDAKIYHYAIPLINIKDTVIKILSKLDEEKSLSAMNKEKVLKMVSWTELIPKWHSLLKL